MADVSSQARAQPFQRKWSWLLVLVATWLVTVAGFVFALHQFTLKYLYDQSSYTRTLGGVLMILIGFAGIFLPIFLRRNRHGFLALPPLRQWLFALAIPLFYILFLGVCFEASHRSRTIILPRPFTPTAIVHYRPGDSRVEFRGGWRPSVSIAGYNDAEVLADGSEKFSSYLHESFIRDAFEGPETVEILGRAKQQPDGNVTVVLDVDARESIRFAVENLDDVTILRNGRSIDESDRQAGKFSVTIIGRPRKDT